MLVFNEKNKMIDIAKFWKTTWKFLFKKWKAVTYILLMRGQGF